jgi:flagellar basal body-associated protein FliL
MIAIIVLCVALLGAVLTIILYFTIGPGTASTNTTATGSSSSVLGDFSMLNNAMEWAAYAKA